METREYNLLKRLIQPLSIIPTAHPVSYFPTSAKVVLFDIYGTLLSSAAGDVGPDAATGNRETFTRALVDAGLLKGAIEHERASLFDEGIIEEAVAYERKLLTEKGVEYPEVDILRIWVTVLEKLGFTAVDEQTLRLTALSYECRVNQVWPMEGLDEVLRYLMEQGKQLGILSNAQFYTPMLLDFFLGQSLEETGFLRELMVWSFEEGIGKPATRFFSKMNSRLEKIGILPEEVLFVGNDMLKDVVAGKKAGWQTVLFAGDVRSLRLHEEHPEVQEQKPDMVIIDLAQLKNILQ